MGKLTPEAGGNQGTPHNQDHEHFKALKEEGRLRPSTTKPKEIFRVFYGKPPEGEVPGDASNYLSDPHFRGFAEPMRPAVLESIPPRQRRDNTQLPEKLGEQRGESGQSQPNLTEQQTSQRRRTQRERARLAQDQELRSLTRQLIWGLPDEGVTDVIVKALEQYPELPPDEALKEFDRNTNTGFSFP